MTKHYIVVQDLDGGEHRLDAVEGWQVMEIIREGGLPIKADCGGACACATCHVYVADEWKSRLQPPSEQELFMLDYVLGLKENSRLSCQIAYTATLAGLRLELAPD